MTLTSESEGLEPHVVNLIAYQGVGFKVPEKIKANKKLKWKVVYCQGKDKKLSSQAIECSTGDPIFNSTTQITLSNSKEHLALLVLCRDIPVGQVVIPISDIPAKEDPFSSRQLSGELEPVKNVSDPSGLLVYGCSVESYRPINQSGKYAKKESKKSLSFSKNSLFGRSSQSVASEADSLTKSRKSTPSVKKLKLRLFAGKKSKSKLSVGDSRRSSTCSEFDASNHMNPMSLSMSNLAWPKALDEETKPKFTACDIDIDDANNPFRESSDFPSPDLQGDKHLTLPSIQISGSFNKKSISPSSTESALKKAQSSACIFSDAKKRFSSGIPEISDVYPWESSSKGGKEVRISGSFLVQSGSDLIGAWLAGVRCQDIHLVTADKIVVISGPAPDKGCSGPVELETKSYGRFSSEKDFTYAPLPTGIGLSGSRIRLDSLEANFSSGSGLIRSPSCSALASEPSPKEKFTFHSRSNSGVNDHKTKPPPKPASTAMSKSKSAWDLFHSNDAESPKSKLRKRDSGKGTFSKKQLLADNEALKNELDRMSQENQHLRQVVGELRLQLRNKDNQIEVMEATHQDDLLELQNYIDHMQSKIIEKGYLELLEKPCPKR